MSGAQGGRSSGWALACALALHAGVIAVAASLRPEPPRSISVPAPSALEIEVSVEPARAAHASVAVPSDPGPRLAALAHGERIQRSRDEAGEAPADAEISLGEPPAAETEAPAPLAPRRKVELGLNGSITRGLVLDAAREPRQAHRPSPGLLEEGMAEMAARQGSGRSSAAIQAAIGSARLGPDEGSAVFEVRADRSGSVISVTLVSFGSSPARWNAVASELRRRLVKRKLRVPSGTSGLSAVFRIERGALAGAVPSRQQTKRGVALGQDSLGPKDVRDESTRAHFENGRPSPTSNLGTRAAAGGAPTRVVLLSERVL